MKASTSRLQRELDAITPESRRGGARLASAIDAAEIERRTREFHTLFQIGAEST